MKIFFDKEYEYSFDFEPEELFYSISDTVIDVLKIDDKKNILEISVILTGDEEIRELNKEYRNIDNSTDVLSFQMLSYNEPGVIKNTDLNFEIISLGDIIISVPHIINQAREYSHSIYRETAFLFTHGLLHLLGFDHIDDNDRIVMEKLQNTILDTLHIKR